MIKLIKSDIKDIYNVKKLFWFIFIKKPWKKICLHKNITQNNCFEHW